jgi:hypothetical protein
MRQFILSTAIIFFLHGAVKSQAYSGQSDYNKNMISAVLDEYPYEEGTVDNAIDAKFKGMGYNSKGSGDYKVFKAVKLTDIGPDVYDLYFKTDRKSKKEKGRTVVYLLISKGNENFVSEAADTALFANVKSFLNNLITDVAAADLEKQIADQEDVVKKANKKMSNLQDDGQDLAKKLQKIQQQIADNKNAQADQQKEVAAQAQILDTLKAKRKQ